MKRMIRTGSHPCEQLVMPSAGLLPDLLKPIKERAGIAPGSYRYFQWQGDVPFPHSERPTGFNIS